MSPIIFLCVCVCVSLMSGNTSPESKAKAPKKKNTNFFSLYKFVVCFVLLFVFSIKVKFLS